jgi:hypothetical protein
MSATLFDNAAEKTLESNAPLSIAIQRVRMLLVDGVSLMINIKFS